MLLLLLDSVSFGGEAEKMQFLAEEYDVPY